MKYILYIFAAILISSKTAVSQIICNSYEVYQACGTLCPLSCAQPTLRDCGPCVRGCFCRRGYVRDTSTWECITPDRCPPIICPPPVVTPAPTSPSGPPELRAAPAAFPVEQRPERYAAPAEVQRLERAVRYFEEGQAAEIADRQVIADPSFQAVQEDVAAPVAH